MRQQFQATNLFVAYVVCCGPCKPVEIMLPHTQSHRAQDCAHPSPKAQLRPNDSMIQSRFGPSLKAGRVYETRALGPAVKGGWAIMGMVGYTQKPRVKTSLRVSKYLHTGLLGAIHEKACSLHRPWVLTVLFLGSLAKD